MPAFALTGLVPVPVPVVHLERSSLRAYLLSKPSTTLLRSNDRHHGTSLPRGEAIREYAPRQTQHTKKSRPLDQAFIAIHLKVKFCVDRLMGRLAQ